MADSKDVPSRGAWDNPAVLAASVSGMFALLGTLTAGLIGWINRPDVTENHVQERTVNVIRLASSPDSVTAQGVTELNDRDAGGNHFRPETRSPGPLTSTALDELQTQTSAATPDWRLNFVEFQRVLKNPATTPAQQDSIIAECMGQRIVWEGYVDEVTVHSQPTEESAATVTLCESVPMATQTMFQRPAFCRFPAERLADIQNLKPHDRIIITGTFDSHSAIGTILKGCAVLRGHSTRVASGIPQTVQ